LPGNQDSAHQLQASQEPDAGRSAPAAEIVQVGDQPDHIKESIVERLSGLDPQGLHFSQDLMGQEAWQSIPTHLHSEVGSYIALLVKTGQLPLEDAGICPNRKWKRFRLKR
jgi:hypothetical protein